MQPKSEQSFVAVPNDEYHSINILKLLMQFKH